MALILMESVCLVVWMFWCLGWLAWRLWAGFGLPHWIQLQSTTVNDPELPSPCCSPQPREVCSQAPKSLTHLPRFLSVSFLYSGKYRISGICRICRYSDVPTSLAICSQAPKSLLNPSCHAAQGVSNPFTRRPFWYFVQCNFWLIFYRAKFAKMFWATSQASHLVFHSTLQQAYLTPLSRLVRQLGRILTDIT